VFWLVMPPALIAMLLLGWVERSWFGRPSAPPRPPVDTKLAEIPTDSNLADAVAIEAEPDVAAGESAEHGPSPQALARVRDDTMFRATEREAWFQLWAKLRSTGMPGLAHAAAQRVGFTELFGQPRSYRGRLVRFRGTLHRLEQVPAPENPDGIQEYWQGWLEPEGGPAAPIVVFFLELPAGMPHGMKISEPVEVVGSFFKRWAYAATDTVRTAPLVLALEPLWKPRRPASSTGHSIGAIALGTMTVVVIVTMLGIHAAGRGPRRIPPPPPTDLNTVLADIDLFSPDAALRQLTTAERVPDPSPAKEPLP